MIQCLTNRRYGIITPAEPPYIPEVKVQATHIVTNYDDGSDRLVDQYVYISAPDATHMVTMAGCPILMSSNA